MANSSAAVGRGVYGLYGGDTDPEYQTEDDGDTGDAGLSGGSPGDGVRGCVDIVDTMRAMSIVDFETCSTYGLSGWYAGAGEGSGASTGGMAGSLLQVRERNVAGGESIQGQTECFWAAKAYPNTTKTNGLSETDACYPRFSDVDGAECGRHPRPLISVERDKFLDDRRVRRLGRRVLRAERRLISVSWAHSRTRTVANRVPV